MADVEKLARLLWETAFAKQPGKGGPAQVFEQLDRKAQGKWLERASRLLETGKVKVL